jgi:hypothetical protein
MKLKKGQWVCVVFVDDTIVFEAATIAVVLPFEVVILFSPLILFLHVSV